MKIEGIRPVFNRVLLTARTERVVESGFVKGDEEMLSMHQEVVAIGDMVKCVSPGEIVCIDPSSYAIRKHKPGSLKDGVIEDNVIEGYDIPMVEIDGVPYLYVYDRDIKYVALVSKD